MEVIVRLVDGHFKVKVGGEEMTIPDTIDVSAAVLKTLINGKPQTYQVHVLMFIYIVYTIKIAPDDHNSVFGCCHYSLRIVVDVCVICLLVLHLVMTVCLMNCFLYFS